MDTCYVALGCDCSVSYNLRALGLQIHGTMPFDWMRIDNLDALITILASGFKDIAVFSQYKRKPQSDNFDNNSIARIKSRIRLVHKVYKFILPHEYQDHDIDITGFEARYARRISRFLALGKDQTIRKVFVRLGTTSETTCTAYESLYSVLRSIGFSNYEVKMVNMDEWLPGAVYEWKRHYIPWEKILINYTDRKAKWQTQKKQ